MALPNGDLITTPFDPQMAYPSDRRMQVDTLNSRDSMSMFIRWEGMEVYVLETSKKYILQGGRSNEYWKENGIGSGTGGTTFVGQFPTADLLPTSGRSAGDYAFVGTGDDFVQYNWDNIAGQWVMAEGQTDMASEFFHIGYKTPLIRPVIFPLFPKDVLVETSGDFVFAPETAVARFVFTGEVTAIRGIETAAADREIKLVNRTGSDIILRDKASGIPTGSGFDFGGTDYTWVNGSEITLKGNGTYWQLAPNNNIAFSDHLDSVNAQVSVGSDGLEVITGVYDRYIGQNISFKEYAPTPDLVDGIVFVQGLGKYWKRATVGPIPIEYFGTSTTEIQSAIDSAIANKFGLQFEPLKIYEFGQITIPGEVEIWVNGATLKFNGTTASPFIDITGNNVKMYDVVAEAPITQSRQFDIRGDNFYSNYIKVNGGSYAINLRGNNPTIDRVEGIDNNYTPLRVFSNVKDIESIRIGTLISINFRMKGFVHNGAFSVKNINIDNFYSVTNSTDDASNGFLIDPDLPTTQHNVESVNIINFYCRGTQSGALKAQNVKRININNYTDDFSTDRVYASSYSITTIGVPFISIDNLSTYDRISFNRFDEVIIKKLKLTTPQKTVAEKILLSGDTSRSFSVDRLVAGQDISTTTGQIIRQETGINGRIMIGELDIPEDLTLVRYFSGHNKDLIFIANNRNNNIVSTGSTVQSYSKSPLLIRRMSSPPSQFYWEQGEIVLNTSPNDFLGWVCIESGTPGLWKPIGRTDKILTTRNSTNYNTTSRDEWEPNFTNFTSVNSGTFTIRPNIFKTNDEIIGFVSGAGNKTIIPYEDMILRGANFIVRQWERFVIKFISPTEAIVTILGTPPNASTTQRGIIEQATDAEIKTGTDTERAVDPKGLKDNYISYSDRTITSSGTIAITPLTYNVRQETIIFTGTAPITLNGFNSAVSNRNLVLVNQTGGTITIPASAGVTVPFAAATTIGDGEVSRFMVYNNLILKEV